MINVINKPATLLVDLLFVSEPCYQSVKVYISSRPQGDGYCHNRRSRQPNKMQDEDHLSRDIAPPEKKSTRLRVLESIESNDNSGPKNDRRYACHEAYSNRHFQSSKRRIIRLNSALMDLSVLDIAKCIEADADRESQLSDDDGDA